MTQDLNMSKSFIRWRITKKTKLRRCMIAIPGVLAIMMVLSSNGIAGYCDYPMYPCDRTTDSGIPFTFFTAEDKATYDAAVAACGGEENMLTLTDLGCDKNTNRCADSTAVHLKGWLAGDTGNPDDAFLVHYGKLVIAGRAGNQLYILCK